MSRCISVGSPKFALQVGYRSDTDLLCHGRLLLYMFALKAPDILDKEATEFLHSVSEFLQIIRECILQTLHDTILVCQTYQDFWRETVMDLAYLQSLLGSAECTGQLEEALASSPHSGGSA